MHLGYSIWMDTDRLNGENGGEENPKKIDWPAKT